MHTYMIISTIILIFLFITISAWFVHYAFHQPWSGPFYKSHMDHHLLKYPADSFLSTSYRGAGKNSSLILFMIAFAPIIIGVLLLSIFGIWSWFSGMVFIISMIIWGLINNYLHDNFHIQGTYAERFPIFMKWREIHRLHHNSNMDSNFGIMFFIWDKIFGTFKINSLEE